MENAAILSHKFLAKNFVKVTFLLNKLLGIRKIHRPHRPQTSYTDHLFFIYFLELGKYTDLSFHLFFILGKYTDLYLLTF